MSFNVFSTPPFEKRLKKLARKYPSLKSDVSQLIQSLAECPEQGIPLGKNCYKIRIAISSKKKGKSGGGRVITYVQVLETTIYLLSIYDKSEQSDIGELELQRLLNTIEKSG